MTVFTYVATLMLFAVVPAWIRAKDGVEYAFIFAGIFMTSCMGIAVLLSAWKWVFG